MGGGESERLRGFVRHRAGGVTAVTRGCRVMCLRQPAPSTNLERLRDPLCAIHMELLSLEIAHGLGVRAWEGGSLGDVFTTKRRTKEEATVPQSRALSRPTGGRQLDLDCLEALDESNRRTWCLTLS